MNRKIIVTILAYLMIPLAASAQEDACIAYVEAVAEEVNTACADVGTDAVCLGNPRLKVKPESADFSQPGDMLALDGVESLTLSSMSEAFDAWGVVQMDMQDVQVAVFGDVALRDIDTEARTFNFRSAGRETLCANASLNGVLVQTPDDDTDYAVTVNAVRIDMQGTVFLRTSDGIEMWLFVLDGEADFTADGETTAGVMAPKLFTVRVDTDNMAQSSGRVSEGYDADALLHDLPVALLSNPVSVPSNARGLVPISGTWTTPDCDGLEATETIIADEDSLIIESEAGRAELSRSEDGAYLVETLDGVDVRNFQITITFTSVSENRMEITLAGPNRTCDVVSER